MGHYDSYYEERAREDREEAARRQAKCPHIDWTIKSVDSMGRPKEIFCNDCKLLKNLKEAS